MTGTMEKQAIRLPGVVVFIAASLLSLVGLGVIGALANTDYAALSALVIGGLVLMWITTLSGFIVVQPNDAVVITFFGRYVGTLIGDGFHWTVPFSNKNRISMRVRNFDSAKLKVNDAAGNPIEIAAVIVWRVVHPARAWFDVENYGAFIKVQAEIALRGAAAHYPYDGHDVNVHSLRSHPDEVAGSLQQGLQRVLNIAGIEVLETRLSHLAYAPEIAQTMLRRQQAEAVIAARQKIVEGAVGMVHMALHQLESNGVVTLDDDKRAAMVNNLLVALVSEESSQPVINAGTLY